MSPSVKMTIRLFLPFFAIHCTEQVYFVFGTLLARYGLSHQEIGWILSVYFIAIMTIRPLGGLLLETFGIRRTLMGAGLVGFIGCMFLFFSTTVPFLIFGRVLSGISFGVYCVALFSYQALVVPAATRAATMSIISSGGILPMGSVTPLGEWLLMGGFEHLYLIIGPLCSALCVYLGSFVNDDYTLEKKPVWGKYSDLQHYRPFVVLLASGALMALIDASVVSISVLAAERGAMASFFLASSSITAVVVRTAFSHQLGLLPGSLILCPAALAMGLAVFLVSVFPSNFAFMLGGAIFGVGIGAGFPIYLALTAEILPPSLRPKGTAASLIVYDSGWILTPLLVGYCSSLIGTAWTFRLLSLTASAALAMIFVMYWQRLGRKRFSTGTDGI